MAKKFWNMGGVVGRLSRRKPMPLVRKSNRAAAVDLDRYKETAGLGQDWARTVYGDYYAISVPIHAAIKIRSEALARPPMVVLKGNDTVDDAHPAQRLLNRVNKWYSRGELWRATETYLSLWGSAFWALERDERGQWEMWALRPDRVRILAGQKEVYPGVRVFWAHGTGGLHP